MRKPEEIITQSPVLHRGVSGVDKSSKRARSISRDKALDRPDRRRRKGFVVDLNFADFDTDGLEVTLEHNDGGKVSSSVEQKEFDSFNFH